MALAIDSDAYSRRSRRHGTSGRRRTTSYEKYGYQLTTTLGPPSSFSSRGTEAVMHVLRVQPGMVVNYIEAPSRSRSGRSRTGSHVSMQTHKGPRDRRTDGGDESSWEMTHSPHARTVELFDGGKSSRFPPPPPPNYLSWAEAEPPPREMTRRSTEPHQPREPPDPRRSTPPLPSPQFTSEPHRLKPLPPPPPHSSPEIKHQNNTIQSHESRRQLPAPMDITNRVHSPDPSHHSHSTISFTSSSSTNNHHDKAPQLHHHHSPHPPSTNVSSKSSSTRSPSHSPEHQPEISHSLESHPVPIASRTVRFNDDPVQPSPTPVVRRKGWWNRRGDQLWDNDGSYAPAREDDTYPLDLEDYPEPGVGWMNEEGVKIDTKRRLVRKKPLRSALKKSPSSG